MLSASLGDLGRCIFGSRFSRLLVLLAATPACGGKSDSGDENGVGGASNVGRSGAASSSGGSKPTASSSLDASGGVRSSSGVGGSWTSLAGASMPRGGSTASNSGNPGSAGAAGDPRFDFCTGDTNLVITHEGMVTPTATNFESAIVMDCCSGLGVALHTRDTLGFDLALEFVYQGGLSAGTYTLTRPIQRISGTAGKLGASPANSLSGSVTISGEMFGTVPWHFGLCAVVDDSAKEFAGTHICIRQATMMPPEWVKRFQIFLLADPGITPTQAQSMQLNTMTLASSAWLDLLRITYVEQTSGSIELTPGYATGSSLRSQLDEVSVAGRPFVAVADGERVYLGTFYRSFSSLAPVGPFITVDDITDDRIPVSAPFLVGEDPRFDPRIVKVLTESGKIVP